MRIDLAGEWGRLPGERSISRDLRKAVALGLVERKRVYPGGKLPNGNYSRRGTTTNVLTTRQRQRAILRERKKAERAKKRARELGGEPARAQRVAYDDWQPPPEAPTPTQRELVDAIAPDTPDELRALLTRNLTARGPPRSR